jgi:hypothetical protein
LLLIALISININQMRLFLLLALCVAGATAFGRLFYGATNNVERFGVPDDTTIPKRKAFFSFEQEFLCCIMSFETMEKSLWTNHVLYIA